MNPYGPYLTDDYPQEPDERCAIVRSMLVFLNIIFLPYPATSDDDTPAEPDRLTYLLAKLAQGIEGGGGGGTQTWQQVLDVVSGGILTHDNTIDGGTFDLTWDEFGLWDMYLESFTIYSTSTDRYVLVDTITPELKFGIPDSTQFDGLSIDATEMFFGRTIGSFRNMGLYLNDAGFSLTWDNGDIVSAFTDYTLLSSPQNNAILQLYDGDWSALFSAHYFGVNISVPSYLFEIGSSSSPGSSLFRIDEVLGQVLFGDLSGSTTSAQVILDYLNSSFNVTKGGMVINSTNPPSGELDIYGRIALSSRTSLDLSTDQDNLDVGNTSYVVLNNSDVTARSISGFAGGYDGRILIICLESGSSNLEILEDSGSSNPENRIRGYMLLKPKYGCALIYDSGISRWRIFSSYIL